MTFDLKTPNGLLHCSKNACLRGDNASTAAPTPEIAVSRQVLIVADTPGYSGEIAIVENIAEYAIATKLLSGEVASFHINEVKPLSQGTYQALTTILATIKSLHLAKLRTKPVEAQPTIGKLAIAIASYLHKFNTKHNGGGVTFTTCEYSELTELIQQQKATIQQLKAEQFATAIVRNNTS